MKYVPLCASLWGIRTRCWIPQVSLVLVATLILVLCPSLYDFVDIDVLLRIDTEELNRIFLLLNGLDCTNSSLVQFLKVAQVKLAIGTPKQIR
jgi:hypothetical protein